MKRRVPSIKNDDEARETTMSCDLVLIADAYLDRASIFDVRLATGRRRS
jgi:hypothetical protein